MTADNQRRDDARMETKAEVFDIKALNEDGTFEGYASTFGNIDSYGDVIDSTAFNKVIREAKKTGKYPKLLWQHDAREPIGVFTEMRKDKQGLYVKGKLTLSVSRAKESYDLMKDGAIDSMSIGFSVSEYNIDTKTGIRTIEEIGRLFEVSLVTFPANTQAMITGVKSEEKPETAKDFERFLRDVGGFSIREAKAITAKGFNYGSQRDVDPDELEALKASMNSTFNILKGLTNGNQRS